MTRETKPKRKLVVAVLCIIGTLMLVWWNPTWFFRPLANFFSVITYPLQQGFAWSAFEFGETLRFLGSIGSLKEKQIRIERENERLRADLARIMTLERENKELRQLMQLDDIQKGEIVFGEVIGRNGMGGMDFIIINRGSQHGITVGNPVLGIGGALAGQISRVSLTTAEVKLLPHPESLIGATLATTESNGIVRGDHGLGIVFDLALKSENLKPGEAVVTAGLGGGFPRGLFIGTIESVHPSSDRLFQQAIVISPLPFETLRFVGVMTDTDRYE